MKHYAQTAVRLRRLQSISCAPVRLSALFVLALSASLQCRLTICCITVVPLSSLGTAPALEGSTGVSSQAGLPANLGHPFGKCTSVGGFPSWFFIFGSCHMAIHISNVPTATIECIPLEESLQDTTSDSNRKQRRVSLPRS